jgi:hypothetical protein
MFFVLENREHLYSLIDAPKVWRETVVSDSILH